MCLCVCASKDNVIKKKQKAQSATKRKGGNKQRQMVSCCLIFSCFDSVLCILLLLCFVLFSLERLRVCLYVSSGSGAVVLFCILCTYVLWA